MPNESMLSVTSLHTVSGASLAVLLMVQLLKNMPLIRWVPTTWLALGVGIMLMFTTSPFPTETSEWVVLFLNGLQASFAAIGGYQVFSGTVRGQPSQELEGMKERQGKGHDGRRYSRGA